PGSSEQESRWRVVARCWTGDVWAAAGFVAFSPGIRGDQLRTRDVAVSYAADDAARFRNGIPFPERAGECRRTVFPRVAENPRPICGKGHKHEGIGGGFRRGTAAPTLVREASQTGLVFGRLDRRDGDSGAGSARNPNHGESRRDYGYGCDRTKGRTGRSGDRGSVDCAERRTEDCAGSEADDSDRPEVNPQPHSEPASDKRAIGATRTDWRGRQRLCDCTMENCQESAIGGRYESSALCIGKRSAPAAHYSSG